MIQIEVHEDEVFLSADAAGIDALIESLTYIKEGGDHDHFMSPAWEEPALLKDLEFALTALP